jgi:hypothetical protein
MNDEHKFKFIHVLIFTSIGSIYQDNALSLKFDLDFVP